MLSSGKLDLTFKAMALSTVTEYLTKAEYGYGVGQGRAEQYKKKIEETADEALFDTIYADFLDFSSTAELGTSKKLRNRLGITLCETHELTASVKEIIARVAPYDLAKQNEIMRDALRKRIRENKIYSLAYGSKSSESKETLTLQDRIKKADPEYFKTIDSSTLEDVQDVMARVIDDLSLSKIANPTPVIEALLDDYAVRLVDKEKRQNWALHRHEIKSKVNSVIQSVQHNLEKNITHRYFSVPRFQQEYLDRCFSKTFKGDFDRVRAPSVAEALSLQSYTASADASASADNLTAISKALGQKAAADQVAGSPALTNVKKKAAAKADATNTVNQSSATPSIRPTG